MFKIEKSNKNIEIIELLSTQIKDLDSIFENISNKIFNNLKKLHLGIIYPTISKVINKILDEQLKIFRENLKIRMIKIQSILNNK